MRKTPTGSHRNLTLYDRISIQRFLDQALTYKEIAELVGVHPKTISREVKNRRYAKVKDPSLRKRPCANLKTCTLTDLCDNSYCTHAKVCAKCKQRTCSQYCDRYIPGTCPKLLKPLMYVMDAIPLGVISMTNCITGLNMQMIYIINLCPNPEKELTFHLKDYMS